MEAVLSNIPSKESVLAFIRDVFQAGPADKKRKEFEQLRRQSNIQLKTTEDYVDEILNFADEKEIGEKNKDNSDTDELYNEALEIIKSERKASTSFLQRKLQIGYNRAARIIDQMELNGEVSKANHVGKREVLK